MERERISYLYQQYLSGTLSLEEHEDWAQLLENPDLEEALKEIVEQTYYAIGKEDILNLKENRSSEIFDYIIAQPGSLQVKRLSWRRIAAVAAIVLVVGAGIFFSASLHPKFNPGSPEYANDVKPGKNTATLTLPDGKAINLSEAKTGVVIAASSLKYNDGSALESRDLKAMDNLTITTPRGGTYQITLPDGTKVWLNAASRVTYIAPLTVRGGRRTIKLDGEAYFEVAKNESQPFVVKSKNQEITVLGTHFNVSAYDDEHNIKTTLLEGSVKLNTQTKTAAHPDSDPDLSEVTILKPNQQAVNTGNSIHVKQVDVSKVVAWKDGDFMFKRESLGEIMRSVSRWYNIDVVYAEGVDVNETFSGVVSRSKNISEVLKLMGLNGQLKFKIEKTQITIYK